MGIGTLKPAVFLDRDGVVNRVALRDGKPYPPDSADSLRLVDDAPDSMRRLKQLGFDLVVVTNQPDIARGTQSRAAVDAMHAKLASLLPLDAFYVCDHDGDACDCRKPKPGLLLRASRERGLALGDSFLIGDRWRDVDAGAAAGVRTIWIDYDYSERGPTAEPFARVTSLKEAVACIERALQEVSIARN